MDMGRMGGFGILEIEEIGLHMESGGRKYFRHTELPMLLYESVCMSVEIAVIC